MIMVLIIVHTIASISKLQITSNRKQQLFQIDAVFIKSQSSCQYNIFEQKQITFVILQLNRVYLILDTLNYIKQ